MSINVGELIATIGVQSNVQEGINQANGDMERGGGKLSATAKVLGLGAGALLIAGLVQSMNAEAANAKLAAQLGLSVEESGRIGKAAGELYANNYGDSLENVNDAIRNVIGDIDGMRDASSEDLQSITADVLNLAGVFDQDLGGITKAVGNMMRTGLAANAQEALDIITVGLQGNAKAGEDVLDTFNEYGTQFRKLGLDGATAMGLINQGLKAGALNTDIVADAFKEFSIRAIDGSEATAAGFTAIGLSAEKMGSNIAAGGDTAKAALDVTLDKLRGIEDPAARAAAATALFGTQAEDLGDVLFALDLTTAAEGLGEIEGAAKKVDAQIGGTTAATFEMLKRQVFGLAQDAGGALMPILSTIASFLASTLGPALRSVSGFLKDDETAVRAVVFAVGGMWLAFKGYTAAVAAIKAVQAAMLSANLARELGMAQTGMLALSASAVRTGLALGVVGVAIGVATVLWSQHKKEQEQARAAAEATKVKIQDLTSAIEADSGAIGVNTRAKVANRLETDGVLKSAAALGVSLEDVTAAALGDEAALKRLQAGHLAFIEGTDQAGSASRAWTSDMTEQDKANDATARSWDALLGSVTGTTGELNQAVESVKRVDAATGGATGATKGLTVATDASTDAHKKHKVSIGGVIVEMEGGSTAAQRLSEALDKVSGKNISATEAEIRFNESVAAMTEQLAGNSAKLEMNTVDGRANLSAVLASFSASNGMAGALADQGASQAVVTQKLKDNEAAMRGVLTQMGYTKTEIDALIKKYGGIPKNISTAVVANTGQAVGAVNALTKAFEALATKANSVGNYGGAQAILKRGLIEGMYAGGTDALPDGFSIINDDGPELLYKSGSNVKVMTNRQSVQALGGVAGGGADQSRAVVIHVYPAPGMDEEALADSVAARFRVGV